MESTDLIYRHYHRFGFGMIDKKVETKMSKIHSAEIKKQKGTIDIVKCLVGYVKNPSGVIQVALNSLLFKVTPPPFGFYVYRGISTSAKYSKTDLIKNNKVGMEYTFPTITSTSLNPNVSIEFSSPFNKNAGLLYKIYVPPEFPCVFDTPELHLEWEVLLPVSAKFKITRVYSTAVPYQRDDVHINPNSFDTMMLIVDVIEGYVSYDLDRSIEKNRKVDWKKCYAKLTAKAKPKVKPAIKYY